MKSIRLFLGCCLLLFMGCISQHEEPLPVSQDELVDLVFDIHIAEGAMSQFQGGPKKDSIANQFYDQVAKIHSVDRATLDTCLAIVQRNPELAKAVYEKVMEKMEKAKVRQ